MIQRIQSIFLFLASGSLFALFYAPFASSSAAAGEMMQDQQYSVEDHILLGGLCILGGLLSLIAIFIYKNRPLQLRLGYLVMVSAILLIISSILLFINESEDYGANVQISEGLGLALPILTIILVLVANRFIKKDQKLVKSMDRLR